MLLLVGSLVTLSCDTDKKVTYTSKLCGVKQPLQLMEKAKAVSMKVQQIKDGCFVVSTSNKATLDHFLTAHLENPNSVSVTASYPLPSSTKPVKDVGPGITFPNIFDVFNRLLKQLNP